MAGPPPSQNAKGATALNMAQKPAGRTSYEREGGGLQPPAAVSAAGGRTLSASTARSAAGSFNPSFAPGSFSSELRSQMSSSRAGSRMDVGSMYPGNIMDKVDEDEDDTAAQQALVALKDRLNRELKIREGSENMLEALNAKKAKQTKEQRQRVEAELSASNSRIRALKQKIADIQHTRTTPQQQPTTPTKQRERLMSNGMKSPPNLSRSDLGSDVDESTESPTYALTELLQALEVEGMTPEYYVSRGNQLVDLFKRHPTLKYDLMWSVFGLRMQVMLLSESREVVAAGYRMTRYAISDRASLRKIRSLNTDYVVVRSLNNYRKADVEREQALKFVRAFLDVKDGVKEISRAIVRTIVAIAEAGDDRRPNMPVAEQDADRLRPICIETLAEILVRDPRLLVASGGMGPLSEALAEGTYKAPESLAASILYLLDTPRRRKYVQPGYGLDVLFTAFTDHMISDDSVLKQNAKAIAASLKSWSGLMSLSMYNFRAVRSLISCMILPSASIRETILDLFFSLLRIKPPAWATSFLAGRRLTTYGRVANLKGAGRERGASIYVEEDGGEQNFVEHYTALLLAVFIKADLLKSLLHIAQTEEDPMLKRKTTLLLSEVLKLASRLLPPSWSSELQLLPDLFNAAASFKNQDYHIATGVVYQMSSVSRTLYRSTPSGAMPGMLPSSNSMSDLTLLDDQPKSHAAVVFDDATFRQLLIDSRVLNHSNWSKWDWDIIFKIIDGPLQVGKRLEEAIKASKFMKRIMSFYRPFKYKFAEVKNTRGTQKYVKVGCALMHALLQSPEGVRFLADSKLLRQVAECLAQCDPTSGLTAQYPMFSPDRLLDTLCGGYFPMLGVLSGDPRGLQLLERWRMFNMMYHIVDLKQRPDLIKLLLSSFDYTVQGHPRVLLSKALTAGTKDIRIHATNALRKHAIRPTPSINSQGGMGDSKWAIQLLVTQLYDPEVDVCSTAIKILEKACNRKPSLEYIVECRPSLDHLGEIGAPLLLRFLSTSIGYHYLDGLDYISNEMDDWFLGRNDTYVHMIEASLARAFLVAPDDQSHRMSLFDDADAEADFHDNHVPPHFYRELTRTQEGCRLLNDKGHFEEFASTIRNHGMRATDPETLLKVKGALWAVGNVGSMELGAPFLEGSDVVERIIAMAESHDVISLRGTAFFVLGLISRSTHGLEILAEHGWDANTTPMGTSLGFCIPNDLSKLLSLVPWNAENVANMRVLDTQCTISTPPAVSPARPNMDPAERPPLVTDEDMNKRILELIVDLGNMVLYKKALVELQKLRARKPAAFNRTDFFKEVMGLMEWNHYRLGVRRMVIDLFDKNVMRRIVFDEEGSSSSGEDDDDDEEDEEDDDDSEDDEEDTEEESGGGRLMVSHARRGHGPGGDESSSGDDRTERQRSISEPMEPKGQMMPAPLNIRRGLEADQKVIAAHGCYAMTATTALTVQNTQGVTDIHHVPVDFVRKQIDAVVADIGVDVVKTGMLASKEVIEMLDGVVKEYRFPELVIDPVMVSTSGSTLLPETAIEMLTRLFPHASVVAPNIPEANLILAQYSKDAVEIKCADDMVTLATRLQTAMGSRWVLVKGGHSPFDAHLKVTGENVKVVDVLVGADGTVEKIVSDWQDSQSTHGTGCSLASAIASNLAAGKDMTSSVRAACRYIEAGIRTAPGLGHGHGPLNHFHSTKVLPFSPNYFLEYLISRPDVKPIWDRFVHHPFVMAMGDGSLPLDSFKNYMIQDYLYLIHFARATALGAYKSKNMTDISRASEIVAHIMTETKLHIKYCESFGMSLEQMESTEEHQACTAYTRYVVDVGQSEDWLALQVAQAPCLLGYAAVARMLHRHPETKRKDNTYWEWIENYIAEDYSEAVRLGSDLLEEHAALQSPTRVEELVKIFVHATKMEIGFWEMFPHK
ncbi:uncharacterized protein J7T54_007844 [Emericellopsis cladophorae]|uniref:REM-1 domain-containing protein n=1 Tax=Emericellopsis cladophorae TaxID=2686198 RepID=A0A9P9Y768_9HYPO|nr:uncharacterized protein J7T54_007844 [Emericellopsis cladophorae]KAI6784751.1 hypothetical protein J7T54_007844 [Emericellopsis cladophorae]